LEYEVGLYTKSVNGVLNIKDAAPSHRPFILVRDYHRTFIETSQGYLNRVTASVVLPNAKGKYSVPYSSDTVKLELTYYAHNNHMRVQEFQRSLGIGSYTFDVNLEEDKDWKNSYHLFIKPVLIEFITEQRYRMNNVDKYFIGEWLAAAEEQF
jgi:hypothetical protein